MLADLLDQPDGLSLSGSQLTAIAAWIGTGVGCLGAFAGSLTWWFVQKHLPSIAEGRVRDAEVCRVERTELTKAAAAERAEVLKMFVDQADRRNLEQLNRERVMVEQMKDDRHEVGNQAQRVIAAFHESEERIREDIQKSHGYVRANVIVPIAIFAFLLFSALHCSNPNISPSRRAFVDACTNYNQQ